MPPRRTTVAYQLADFLSTADAPAFAAREVKRLILNGLSATLLARGHPAIPLLETYAVEPGCQSRLSKVMWSDARVTSEVAAFLNSAAWEIDSFNETYLPTYIHPTAATASAALSEGEVGGYSGTEVLRAIALGIEAMIAVSHVLMPEAYVRGFAPIPLHSSVGAAAACVALKRLDRDVGSNALGIAMLGSAGPFEGAGTTSHVYTAATAVRNGIVATHVAERGLETSPTAFEGQRGMVRSFAGDGQREIESTIANLGTSWKLGDLSYMAFPAETYMQAALETVVTAQRREPDARLCLRANPLVVRIAEERAQTFGDDVSLPNATSDLRYAVAAAWLNGRYTSSEKSREMREDPAVLSLRRSLVLEPDGDIPLESACLQVTYGDGHRDDIRVDAFAGSTTRPFEDAALIEKFKTCSDGVVPPDQVTAIIDGAQGLERYHDVGDFMALVNLDESPVSLTP